MLCKSSRQYKMPQQVIKVGTSSLLRPEHNTLNLSNLAGLCETVKELKTSGHHVIIVSSGAVGVGCQRLGLETRPTALAQKQALAAVGQKCAQVLLTQDNLSTRSQYNNAANTFFELLKYGAVPVVNENDTVAVEQLRFGDNDTLSALVAALVHADWLFLMTDVSFLYTANPNTDPTATPIYEVTDMNELAVDTSTKGTQWGTGGMGTKLTAARIATAAGCKMAICNAVDPGNILGVLAGEQRGTVFHALPKPPRDRKRWILSMPLRGALWLDAGAVVAVRDKNKSLFSAGIVKVVGDFAVHDAVRLCDANGVEFARGLVNYDHEEVTMVKGKASRDIPTLLGYEGSEEIVHRNKICLVALPVGGDPHDGEHDGEHDGGDDGQGGLMEGVAGGRGAAVVDDVHSTKYQQHHHQKHEKQVRTMIEGPAGGMGDDDVAERLAVLRQRQDAALAAAAAGSQDGWVARMRAAVEQEASGVEEGEQLTAEDIDEGGWLPR